jgi:hypothetical protein
MTVESRQAWTHYVEYWNTEMGVSINCTWWLDYESYRFTYIYFVDIILVHKKWTAAAKNFRHFSFVVVFTTSPRWLTNCCRYSFWTFSWGPPGGWIWIWISNFWQIQNLLLKIFSNVRYFRISVLWFCRIRGAVEVMEKLKTC